MFSIQDHFPVYSVFLLILIISGAPLFELFSCKIRHLFQHNILFVHLISYLTLVFFIVITIPIREKHILKIIPKSVFLYAFFLGLIKTAFPYFISILGIIMVIYVLVLYKSELQDSMDTIRTRIIEEDPNLAENEKKWKLSTSPHSTLSVMNDMKKEPAEIEDIKTHINNLVFVNNSLFVLIVPLYIIGIYIYMRSKMSKYKSKFSYATFFIGKSVCGKNSTF